MYFKIIQVIAVLLCVQYCFCLTVLKSPSKERKNDDLTKTIRSNNNNNNNEDNESNRGRTISFSYHTEDTDGSASNETGRACSACSSTGCPAQITKYRVPIIEVLFIGIATIAVGIYLFGDIMGGEEHPPPAYGPPMDSYGPPHAPPPPSYGPPPQHPSYGPPPSPAYGPPPMQQYGAPAMTSYSSIMHDSGGGAAGDSYAVPPHQRQYITDDASVTSDSSGLGSFNFLHRSGRRLSTKNGTDTDEVKHKRKQHHQKKNETSSS